MSQESRLLQDVAENLHILKGNTETTTAWEARVLYSICGEMALASLWDMEGKEEAISITHFKRRIQEIRMAYTQLCPHLAPLFESKEESVIEEIYKIYLTTGFFYHFSYRLAPVVETCAMLGDIYLIRGGQLNRRVFFSGLAPYQLEEPDPKIEMKDFKRLFCIPMDKMIHMWEKMKETLSWEFFQGGVDMEFLRTRPPFHYGYWQHFPEKTKQISMFRTKCARGNKQYFLYRTDKGTQYVSRLPEWMTTHQEYIRIAAFILQERGTLPPIRYKKDGNIVSVQFGYLLPPAERNFVKLLSWPNERWVIENEFERVFPNEIFQVLYTILHEIGYQWKEVN